MNVHTKNSGAKYVQFDQTVAVDDVCQLQSERCIMLAKWLSERSSRDHSDDMRQKDELLVDWLLRRAKIYVYDNANEVSSRKDQTNASETADLHCQGARSAARPTLE